MNISYEKLDLPEVSAVIFHPRHEAPVDNQKISNHQFLVEDGVQIGARFHLEDQEGPIILFFHGNGEIASDYDEIGAMYNKFGLNFLAVDYRGYGISGGTPTATSMLGDALTIFTLTRQMMTDMGYKGSIFVMGRSLGSSCAIEIAANFQDEIAGLMIDSGFAMTVPLLVALGVDAEGLGIAEKDGFRNAQKIATITKPTFMLHGQYDQIIPLTSAEDLQAQSAAKNKQFHVIPGADHNSLIEKVGEMYFAAIKQFIDKVLNIRPKRYQSRRKKNNGLV